MTVAQSLNTEPAFLSVHPTHTLVNYHQVEVQIVGVCFPCELEGTVVWNLELQDKNMVSPRLSTNDMPRLE